MGILDGGMKIIRAALSGQFEYNPTAAKVATTQIVPMQRAQSDAVSQWIGHRRYRFYGSIYAPTTVPLGLWGKRQQPVIFAKLYNRSMVE